MLHIGRNHDRDNILIIEMKIKTETLNHDLSGHCIYGIIARKTNKFIPTTGLKNFTLVGIPNKGIQQNSNTPP